MARSTPTGVFVTILTPELGESAAAFQIYPKIEPLPLPRDVPQTGVAASPRSQNQRLRRGPIRSLTFGSVAHSLFLGRDYQTARTSRRRNLFSRRSLHRSPLRDRVVRRDWRSRGPGCRVYHFNPADVSLRLLRKGDFRRNLAEATAMEPAVAHAPRRLSAPEHIGGTPGSTRRVLIAISVGQRYAAGEYAGCFCGFGAAGRDRARVRGRRGEPPT